MQLLGEIDRQAHRQHHIADDPDSALPGGESLRAFSERAAEATTIAHDLATEHGPVLIVSHRLLIGAVAALHQGYRHPAEIFRYAKDFHLGPTHLRVLPAAETAVPDDPAYSFLGQPGAPVWVLPEIENPELLWPGLSTEEIEPGAFAGDTVTLTLRRVRGPGALSVFASDPFGAPTVLANSADGTPDGLTLTTGGHQHASWAFTRADVYHFPTQHFDFHRQQLTMSSGGGETTELSLEWTIAGRAVVREDLPGFFWFRYSAGSDDHAVGVDAVAHVEIGAAALSDLGATYRPQGGHGSGWVLAVCVARSGSCLAVWRC